MCFVKKNSQRTGSESDENSEDVSLDVFKRSTKSPPTKTVSRRRGALEKADSSKQKEKLKK